MQKPAIKSVIRIVFNDDEQAETVYRSLKPDDKPLPKSLDLNTVIENRTVIVTVECRRGLTSFLATVDDVLHKAALSETVYKTVKPEHKRQIYKFK